MYRTKYRADTLLNRAIDGWRLAATTVLTREVAINCNSTFIIGDTKRRGRVRRAGEHCLDVRSQLRNWQTNYFRGQNFDWAT